MKWLRLMFVLGIVVAAVVAPSLSSAQVQVIQTDCQAVSTNPPLVRVVFAVLNLGTIPVCSIHLTPISIGLSNADSCKIIECSFPPGWFCQADPIGGAFWRVVAGAACIQFGQKAEPFDIVLDPLYCCYRAEFDDPSGAIFFSTTVCFECAKPTSTRGATWGRLKMMYR